MVEVTLLEALIEVVPAGVATGVMAILGASTIVSRAVEMIIIDPINP